MERISRQYMLMNMAEVAAMRSTCFRGNTGAIIAINSRPISMGYNGPPSGEPHCQGNNCQLTKDGGCRRSDHAEANAIKFVREFYKLKGMAEDVFIRSQLYSTSFPCPVCVSIIVNAKIPKVFYRYPYRDQSGLDYLLLQSEVYRITPSGFIIKEPDNIIIDSELC